MNRVIKFRGQCDVCNEWIEGDLIHGVGTHSGKMYILPNQINLAYVKHCDPLNGVRVKNESIGQFARISDKSDIELVEGDLRQINGKIYKLVNDGWRFRFERNLVEFGENHDIIVDEDTAWDSVLVGNIYEQPNKGGDDETT